LGSGYCLESARRPPLPSAPPRAVVGSFHLFHAPVVLVACAPPVVFLPSTRCRAKTRVTHDGVRRLGTDQYARPSMMHYPAAGGDDFAVRFAYDEEAGDITAIQSKDETQTYWKLQAVDGRGRVQEERFGNGTRAKYTYDPDTLMRNGI